MVKAWEKQKELLKERVPNKNWVIGVAQSIQIPMVKALFSLSYLTAGRISEILAIKKEDIIFTEELIDDIPVNIMVVAMPNRKNRKKHFKEIPVRVDKEQELIKIIMDYTNPMLNDTLLFPISRIKAWRLLNVLGMNPHYIRHIRLSHLVIYHDFTDQLLVQYAGWTNSEPAQHYIHLSYKDLLKKL